MSAAEKLMSMTDDELSNLALDVFTFRISIGIKEARVTCDGAIGLMQELGIKDKVDRYIEMSKQSLAIIRDTISDRLRELEQNDRDAFVDTMARIARSAIKKQEEK